MFTLPLFSDMIGSVDQYAKILGKSVTELADQKYQPPPAEASESEVIYITFQLMLYLFN